MPGHRSHPSHIKHTHSHSHKHTHTHIISFLREHEALPSTGEACVSLASDREPFFIQPRCVYACVCMRVCVCERVKWTNENHVAGWPVTELHSTQTRHYRPSEQQRIKVPKCPCYKLFLQCFSFSVGRVFTLCYNISHRVTHFQFSTFCCCQSGGPRYNFSLLCSVQSHSSWLTSRSHVTGIIFLRLAEKEHFHFHFSTRLPHKLECTTLFRALEQPSDFLSAPSEATLLFPSQVDESSQRPSSDLEVTVSNDSEEDSGRCLMRSEWSLLWAAHYRRTSAAVRPPRLRP